MSSSPTARGTGGGCGAVGVCGAAAGLGDPSSPPGSAAGPGGGRWLGLAGAAAGLQARPGAEVGEVAEVTEALPVSAGPGRGRQRGAGDRAAPSSGLQHGGPEGCPCAGDRRGVGAFDVMRLVTSQSQRPRRAAAAIS